MRAPHFHPLGWDAPSRIGPDDLRAAHEANFDRSGHGQCDELKGGADGRPAVVFVDRDHQRPKLRSSVMAGRCLTIGALERAAKRVGRIVVGAERRDREPEHRADGCHAAVAAVSRRPLFSIRLRMTRISAGVISVMGRLASGAASSCRSQRFLLIVDLGRHSSLQLGEILLGDARETYFSRQSPRRSCRAFFAATGHCRSARSLRASSRLARADASETSGNDQG